MDGHWTRRSWRAAGAGGLAIVAVAVALVAPLPDLLRFNSFLLIVAAGLVGATLAAVALARREPAARAVLAFGANLLLAASPVLALALVQALLSWGSDPCPTC